MSRIFAVCLLFAIASTTCRADEEFTDIRSVHRIRRRHVNVAELLPNGPLKIVTVQHEPYTFITKDSNDQLQYSGFIPDLVYSLSRRLHFDYKFHQGDKFGAYNATSASWDGMIGEVIKNEKNSSKGADMAAAAITITGAREKVVDFVKPFQHLGLNLVVQRPIPMLDPSVFPYTFGIFQPLEPAVWGLVFLSTLVVGLFLWLMNLYNPYEWAGRHTVGLADKNQSETFNLAGSMWFVFTSLQWQGFERAPRSIASRFLSAIWFIFVAILLVTYTAGIVNLLFWASTVHKNIPTQSSFIDLSHLISSGDYKIGVIANSQTHRYMQDVAVGEEFDVIRRMWLSPDGEKQLVPNTEEGLKRVRARKYAFIMESMAAKYEMNKRPCDLTTVGDTFATRSYGFALPMNSPILEELHAGVLEMMEEGDIEALEKKWFYSRGECWNVTVIERFVADVNSALYVDRPKNVDMNMFWGPFVMLVVGIVLSLAIGVAEMMYYRQWGRYKSSNMPQGQQLKMEADEGNI